MDLTRLSNVAFGIAFGGYLVAMLVAFHHLAYRRARSATVATGLAATAAGVHLTSIVLRGIAAGRVPWGNLFEFISVAGFLAVASWLVLERLTRVRAAAGFVLGAVVLTMGGAIALYVPPGPLVPALESVWLRIHVVAAMLGSSMFLLATVFTVLSLFRERGERAAIAAAAPAPVLATVGSGGLPEDYLAGADEPAGETASPESPARRRLPSASALDRLAYRTIAFGFPIWTFAVIAGAIWAQNAWGRYWAWDPKEVWAFVTWVAYAGYLHARATVGWRGKRAAILALVGFGALVFNLVVVSTVVSTLHGYGGV